MRICGASGRRYRAATVSLLDRLSVALPGLCAVTLFVLWAGFDGGYPLTVWSPGTLFLLTLLAVVALALPGVLATAPRLAVVALAFLIGFALWSFLSITWADVEGSAWEGANRTLAYVAAYALFGLWTWTSGTAAALLGAFALGTTAVGVGFFLRATVAADPDPYFITARFSEPVGYANANAALFLAAFWPALFVASRRETPTALRALCLAAAGVLLQLAILPQSRGSLFAFPIVLALYLAVVPGRLRSLVTLAPVAAVTALSSGTLLDVFEAASEGDASAALDRARSGLALSAAALLVIGTALGTADRRIRFPARLTRAAGVSVALAAVVGAIAAGAAAVQVGDPSARVSQAWDEFKSGHPAEFGDSRIVGGALGSGRYDFWRVALGAWSDSPALGIGADNFAVAYVKERRTSEEPLYPHSLEVQVLTQTGLIGATLFAGFLVAAVAAALRARFSGDEFRRSVAGAALVGFAYWLVHGSVDWFWEFPVLAAPAFAWLGMAAGLAHPDSVDVPQKRSRAVRVPAIAVGILVTAAATVSLAFPWLSAREVERAVASWRVDAAEAFGRLERARRLNPLTDRPDVLSGVIASRRADWPRMRESFLRAVERNPQNWYSYLELAVAEALLGSERRALAYLAEAEALNPREAAVDLVRERIRAGERVDPRELDEMFLDRLEARTS